MDIRIDSAKPFADGHAFGEAGPYERLKGVVRGTLDPTHPQNTCIVDLDKAPRNADGLVEYEADLEIIRPVAGGGTLLYEVLNRGNKLAGRLNGIVGADVAKSNDLQTLTDAGTGLTFERGLTLVWSGWDPTVASRNNALTVRFPLALENGAPMVRRIREEFQIGKRVASSDTIVLTYPAASLDKAKARLMTRRREGDVRTEVPVSGWEFVDARHVRLLPEGRALEPLTIYELWYEATNSRVAGIAFPAVRDLISFLRHDPKSPLALNPPRHTMAFGISQSARYLRHFLDLDMNRDLAGRRVFDGIYAHTGGAGKTFANHSFAEPNRTTSQHEDRLYPEATFPFSVVATQDPFSDQKTGLFRGDSCDPLLIQSNTSAEYWQKAATLLTTDPLGKADLVMPETTRTYLIVGTQHSAAIRDSERGPNTNANNWQSPLPSVRALMVALHDWVAHGVAPPVSHVPSIADKTAVPFEAVAFPKAPDFALTTRAGAATTTPVDWIDPPGSPGQKTVEPHTYVGLFPAVDADGNEIAGIRLPDVAVPLATFTGWNVYRDMPDEFADRDGSFVPFAVTKAERLASGDPRLSLEERYASHDDYVAQVRESVDRLVAERLLLQSDADVYVATAKACCDFAFMAVEAAQ